LAGALALWAGERPEVRGRPFAPSVGGEWRGLTPDAPPMTMREMPVPFDGGRVAAPGDVPIAALRRR